MIVQKSACVGFTYAVLVLLTLCKLAVSYQSNLPQKIIRTLPNLPISRGCPLAFGHKAC